MLVPLLAQLAPFATLIMPFRPTVLEVNIVLSLSMIGVISAVSIVSGSQFGHCFCSCNKSLPSYLLLQEMHYNVESKSNLQAVSVQLLLISRK